MVVKYISTRNQYVRIQMRSG